MSVFDVPAAQLIDEIAADLKKQGIEQPAWSAFVKTGRHKERVPDSPDWFYVRAASILYRVFKDGPVGAGSLRTYYGGRKNRGTKKHHFCKAGGKLVRTCLQLLEQQGLVKKEKKGRVVTGKGHSYLNKKAKEVGARAAAVEAEEKERREEKAAKAEKEKTGEEKRVAAELRKQEEEKKQKEKEAGREKAAKEAKKQKKEGEEAGTTGEGK